MALYKTSCEVEFGITSLSRKKVVPMKLLAIRRAHWGIETGSHYRRDVTLREDATRFTVGDGARVMANLNNFILALIRQAGFIECCASQTLFLRSSFRCFFSPRYPLFLTLLQPWAEDANLCKYVAYDIHRA